MNQHEPGRNVYIGHRYVPLVIGEWDKSIAYEGLSIVTYQGASYTSKKRVPVGVDITNEEFWVVTGNYNAQVEYYREDVNRYRDEVDGYKEDTDNLINDLNDDFITHKNEVNTSLDNHKNEVNSNLENHKDENDAQLEEIMFNIKQMGATGDGVTDDTVSINNAISYVSNKGGGRVLVPAGTYMIDGESLDDNNQLVYGGVHLKDNVELVFTEGATFKIKPTNKSNYVGLNINKVKNVSIINPTIIGERNEHFGTDGEWGFGISLRGSENIYIERPVAKDCWGDGIYIGTTENHVVNDNVTIINPICDNNRRQGISLISGKNIFIKDSIFKNTNGANPKAGIDIEPNNENDVLKNINIENVYSENNMGPAVLLVLQRLSNSLEEISIRINGIYDNGSSSALFINPVNGNLTGNIEITDITSIKPRSSGLRLNGWGLKAPHIKINNVKIIDHNTDNTEGEIEKNAISFYRGSQEGSTGGGIIGNITIKGIEILNTSPTIKEGAIYVRDGSTLLENVNLLDVTLTNVSNFQFHATGSITGDLIESKINTIDFSPSIFNKKITNENTDGEKVIFLGTTVPVGFPEVEIEVVKNEDIIISTQNVTNILPLFPEVGKNIYSNLIGSRIKLKKATNDSWFITEMIGEWTIRE